MAFPKIKLSDDSGNAVGVTDNRLNVNAYLSATPEIDIGDVSLLLGGTAASVNAGAVGAQTLRVTLASDDPAVTALQIIDDWDAVHDSAVPSDGVMMMGEAKLIDGNILPNYVAEGDAIRMALSVTGTQLVTLTNQYGYSALFLEDTAHSTADSGIMPLAVRNDTLASLVSDDGDYAPLQVDSSGALYVDIRKNLVPAGVAFTNNYAMLAGVVRNDTLANLGGGAVVDGDTTSIQVNALGALYITGGEVENAAVQSEPTLIGGRYDSSARTLGDGDAGAVALNASGHVLMDVVDGGQLDTIIDTLETTLTAIDLDTDAIKTAVQILDNAIDGSEMQVDIVSSATLSVNSHAVTNAGTFAVQSTLQANSGVDIGDVDVTSISAGSNIIGKVGHDITGGADGVKVVSTAGTDVVLGGDVACKKIDIQAQTDNTGLIAVGFTGVDATEVTGTGVILYAGDTYSLEMVNLNLIYIDSTVSGEGVRYTYFT